MFGMKRFISIVYILPFMSNAGLCDKFCPPLMDDGRHVTDYRPSCYVHDLILKQNGLRSSYDLKHFLQNNALKLQAINRQFYDCKNKCANCGDYYLPDPNRHLEFWDNYGDTLGYHNELKFCSK